MGTKDSVCVNGKALAEVINSLGLSLPEASELCGKGKVFMYDTIRRGKIREPYIDEVCKALDISDEKRSVIFGKDSGTGSEPVISRDAVVTSNGKRIPCSVPDVDLSKHKTQASESKIKPENYSYRRMFEALKLRVMQDIWEKESLGSVNLLDVVSWIRAVESNPITTGTATTVSTDYSGAWEKIKEHITNLIWEGSATCEKAELIRRIKVVMEEARKAQWG